MSGSSFFQYYPFTIIRESEKTSSMVTAKCHIEPIYQFMDTN